MRTKQFWSLLVVVAVSLTRIGSGLFSSLSGSTLLYLTDNVGSTVDAVSYVFTGRAAGNLIGSVFCGLLIKYYKKYKPLLTIGIGIVVSGVLMLITPWIHSLAGLVVAFTLTGLLFGYLDAGSQSMYLNLWGEKDSRPYLQSFHFAFGIGAVLAPIIAAPFLEKADSESDSEESCQTSDTYTMYSNPGTYNSSSEPVEESFNPVGWTYVISGSFTIVTGIVMVVLALIKAEEKIKTSSIENEKEEKDEKDEKEEEPIKDLIWLFLPIIIFYFIIVSLEVLYQSYIYSVALCSDLNFTVRIISIINFSKINLSRFQNPHG